MFMCFSKTPALSKSGDARPFSNKADGTILGEGTVLFALRRLADAKRDGDEIYAVINSFGSSSDGRGKSIYAPVAEGQSLCINRAYQQAGYPMSEVGLIEAHGTGTIAGDKAEFMGLVHAMGDNQEKQRCALGTIKSQVGHTKSTAGAAGLFKVAMALHHKVLPPTIKIDEPSHALNIEHSPFYLNTEPRPWILNSKTARKAGVSSFGFGGSNFHITVEEYKGETKRFYQYQDDSEHLFCYSAESTESLVEKLESFKRLCAKQNKDAFVVESRNSQCQFKATFPYRVTLLATLSNRSTLADKVQKTIDAIKKEKDFNLPNSIYYSTNKKQGDIAFLCAGQGSQYLNMGRDLINQFDCARAPWDKFSDQFIISNGNNASNASNPSNASHKSTADYVYPKNAYSESELLSQQVTLNSVSTIQPAIANLSLSHIRLLEKLGITPNHVAGHSFGELTALYLAGVITSEDDYFALAKLRSQLMSDAAKHSQSSGGMTAVNADITVLKSLLAANPCSVQVANHNSNCQSVITGALNDLEMIEAKLNQQKIHFTRLSVPTAFHSPIADCSAEFHTALQTYAFNRPRLPASATEAPCPSC
ncbi:MAG: acyltransferase domain-containing protein, partial [Pseudomonadota bacterium]